MKPLSLSFAEIFKLVCVGHKLAGTYWACVLMSHVLFLTVKSQ